MKLARQLIAQDDDEGNEEENSETKESPGTSQETQNTTDSQVKCLS